MTIKEEIQIEEYKRTFAEAYKQGFIDAMSMCKPEPQTDYNKWEAKPKATIPKENNNCVGVAVAFLEDEPQTEKE